MPNPGRNNIYEAVIRRMVTSSLQAKEEQFALEHEHDADEQLLSYVQECAGKLGHTPWPREIVGGVTILKRFGSWEQVLCGAGLAQPTTANRPARFDRYLQEVNRQKIVYRQKKAIKKQKAQQRLKAQKEKREKRAREMKEKAH